MKAGDKKPVFIRKNFRRDTTTMWTYHSDTGLIETPTGFKLGEAYSGNGAGLNNPKMENVPNHGPIPRGTWEIGAFFNDPEKGPVVCHLMPAEGTETFGRSGFMIHGDNAAYDHTASEGCIVVPRFIREQIAASISVCNTLQVI